MNRRQFLLTTTAAAASASIIRPPQSPAAPTTSSPAKPRPAGNQPSIPDGLRWYDVRNWGVEGRGYDDTEDYYDRLPARAKGRVPDEVWNLSKQPTGMIAHFDADTTDLYIRYRLTDDRMAMPHMAATAVSGIDCYSRPADDSTSSPWRFLLMRRPTARLVAGPLAIGMVPGRRHYRLHFPLFNGIESLEVGLPKDAPFQPVPPRRRKPILFYGTSILHGMAASRPGTTIVNILARRLDYPVLNLAFAGAGKMELEVGRFLNEIDPAIFVLDCVPNCEPKEILDRAEPLVKLWRASHPNTPILLVEGRTFTNAGVIRMRMEENVSRRAAFRRAYENLQQAGVANIHYLPGDHFMGDDGDGTIDGSHPTDVGATHYADAYEPALRKLL